jgi:uncharacterized protein (TIGR02271 family)
MINKTKVREGAVVYSADGEKIGKVRSCEAEIFVIEKGLFFPKDTIARYADIEEASDDGIRMALGKEALTSTSGEVDEGEHAEPQRKPGLKERIEEKLTGRGGEARASGDEIRMPIAEEQLDVSKRDRQAGEVRLRKEVETERQTVDVPVMKERVHVERVPADRSSAPDAGFQPTTTSMPVHEEEVEIRKRPVVKEEVRLRKEREIEHRAADADVRKEHASIEREGAAERLDKEPDEDER